MLENLVYVTLLWYNYSIDNYMLSKKVITADNQQERLRLIGWIVGFTDGEGCFSISVIKNNTTKFGYQVFPEFVITQGEKSKNSLEIFLKFFQCGNIYINKRYDNHKEHLYRYCVRSIHDLSEIIIPFFKKHRLKTGKAKDFKYFAQGIEIISKKKHLTKNGFQKILEIKSKANRKILRDYTPNPRSHGGRYSPNSMAT